MQEQQPKQPQNNDTKLRLCCALAYFSILFFVPLIFFKDDNRAKFHANQGLVLTVTMAIVNVIVAIINIFLPPVVQNALYTIANLIGIAMTLLGVLHVCNEQLKPLPFIGGITLIKSED